MAKVSSSEFLKGYGVLSDQALLEPLTITRNGRDRLVLVSAALYEQMHRAVTRSRGIEQLEAHEIAAIATSRVPDEYAHLDDEIDD